MSCERYWREGIVLAERGEPDPHRDDCTDCQLAHASRQELIEALPLVGAEHSGDPRWQASVWRRIDREVNPARRSWRWQLAGALAITCVLLLWINVGRDPGGPRPRYEVIHPGSVAMRSEAKFFAGDDLLVQVDDKSTVWIYRDRQLELQCFARQTSKGCSPDDHGMTVQWKLKAPVSYHILVVDSVAAVSSGTFDKDQDALATAGIRSASYTIQAY